MVPGTVIAERYRVVKLLGEGGMGAVYEGEHLSVGRKVAIKVLHETFARKKGLVERFEREARAAGAIGHENIIDVFDFGKHDERPYMVMEHLRGVNLSARLDERTRLAPDEATAIMGQVLSALAAAHGAGIVHRDLKPDNVFLITRGGTNDFVKLLDFGISKINDPREGGGKSLTKTGMVMGTPYYMAPEQALAKVDVDGRADVYSAGVMFYEMLTGRVPFNADSETELLITICQRPQEPPTVYEIDSSIPIELSNIVQRAMSHKREDRFQSAQEMLDALTPFGARAALPAGTTGPFRPVNVPTAVGHPSAWGNDAKHSNRRGGSTPTPADPANTPAMVGQVNVPSRGRSLPFVAGAVAIGLAAAVVGLKMRAGGANAATSVAASSDVRVELSVSPPTADVLVDGSLERDRVLRFARGSRHHVIVRAENHREFDQTLVAERDQLLTVALAEDAAPAVVAAPAAPVAPPAAAPTTASLAPDVPVARAPAHRHATEAPAAAPSGRRQAGRPAGSLLPATSEY